MGETSSSTMILAVYHYYVSDSQVKIRGMKFTTGKLIRIRFDQVCKSWANPCVWSINVLPREDQRISKLGLGDVTVKLLTLEPPLVQHLQQQYIWAAIPDLASPRLNE